VSTVSAPAVPETVLGCAALLDGVVGVLVAVWDVVAVVLELFGGVVALAAVVPRRVLVVGCG
jgi:hypothetical protein